MSDRSLMQLVNDLALFYFLLQEKYHDDDDDDDEADKEELLYEVFPAIIPLLQYLLKE